MLYEIGSTVYAGCNMNTSACGDHPAFYHASKGDKLYVIGHQDGPGITYPYSVADNPEGKDSFRCCAKDLMSQKPFLSTNDPTLQPYGKRR